MFGWERRWDVVTRRGRFSAWTQAQFEPDQTWLHQFVFAARRDPSLRGDNGCVHVTAHPGFILFIFPQIIVCLILLGTQHVLKLIHSKYALSYQKRHSRLYWDGIITYIGACHAGRLRATSNS